MTLSWHICFTRDRCLLICLCVAHARSRLLCGIIIVSLISRLKRHIPYRLKAPLGRVFALRDSIAAHRRLSLRPCELQSRHLDGCRLLPDRRALLKLLPSDGVVAEVGVAQGNFSAEILALTHPRKLHLIDLWESSVPGSNDQAFQAISSRFSAEEKQGSVQFHRAYSSDAIRCLPQGSLDWIYLDAGHDYDNVVSDLAAASKAIKPNGLIAGHDYVKWRSWNGRFGVVEAVNEFCLSHDFAFRYLTFEANMHHSFVLQRIG